VAKLMASRAQDHDLVGALVTGGVLDLDVLLERALGVVAHPLAIALAEKLEAFARSRALAAAPREAARILSFADERRAEVFAAAGASESHVAVAATLDEDLVRQRRAADSIGRERIDALRALARVWIAAAPAETVRPLFEALAAAAPVDRPLVIRTILERASSDPRVAAAVRAVRDASITY
jgi:hypothetical protein